MEDIFEKSQKNFIRRDIKKLKAHEAALTELFNAMYKDEILGVVGNPMTLREYLDGDAIVQDLIANIKRRMEYNGFTIQALYRTFKLPEDVTSIKDPVKRETA